MVAFIFIRLLRIQPAIESRQSVSSLPAGFRHPVPSVYCPEKKVLNVSVSPQRSGIETSIRQLIVNGKSKSALDSAKDFHKTQGSAASEILLIDAYLARIQALSDQNLVVEAKSLIALVRVRFPSAGERLAALNATASARDGNLDELLRPLNDPGLTAERRASIEQFIQNEVTDLAALAGCAALPPEHGLRLAAAAIDKAFGVVTSGPVADAEIALAEVSHRSPLAPWKLLIRAIACFYRAQEMNPACECLAGIRSESAAGRLVPAMRAMLDAKPGARPADSLRPAEAALISRTSVSVGELRGALANLDQAFAHAEQPGQVFKADPRGGAGMPQKRAGPACRIAAGGVREGRGGWSRY